MKSGFQLLKTRNINETINIQQFENKYGILLPPIYKLFAETFHLKEDCIETERFIYGEDEYYLTFYEYAPYKELMFAGFNPIDKVYEYYSNMDSWTEKRYLPIGHVAFNGALLLGTHGVEKDNIILHDIDGEVEFTKLCNNVFQFMKGLVTKEVAESELDWNIKYRQLKRKWGEELWRVEDIQDA